MSRKHWCNVSDRWNPEQPLSHCHYVHRKSHIDSPRIEPERLWWKANNRLSAIKVMCLKFSIPTSTEPAKKVVVWRDVVSIHYFIRRTLPYIPSYNLSLQQACAVLLSVSVLSNTLPHVQCLTITEDLQIWTGPERSTSVTPRIFKQSAHESGKIVSSTHRSPSPSSRYPWY